MPASLLKKIFVIAIILIGSFSEIAICQNETKLYQFSPPEFGNGDKAFATYFSERVNLRSRDFKINVTGTLQIKFTLTKNKEVTNIVILDSTNSTHFNKEIIDYLWQGRNNWKTAKINQQPTDINILVSANLLGLAQLADSYILNTGFAYIVDPLLLNRYYNLGADLAGNGQFKEAIPYFNCVLENSPSDVDALFNRGICYLKIDENKKACSDWQTISNMGKPDANKLLLKYCGQ
ncbi:MAG: hypothetical protein JNL49_09270 [Bacteroidia bacterium]|nr:hypothetical protein [Bacteroidia bacterium]